MTVDLKVGEVAPDFMLMDNRNREVRLNDLKGRKVLLSWHPLAWTKVCAEQMKSLEENKSALDKLNTVALGLSVDTVPSKNAWAKSLLISETALLCDFWPHGGTAKRYGLFRDEQGTSLRANLIIDEKGILVWKKIYPIPELPDIEEVLNFLKG